MLEPSRNADLNSIHVGQTTSLNHGVHLKHGYNNQNFPTFQTVGLMPSSTKTGDPSAQKQKVHTELYVWGSDSFGQLGLGHKYLKDDCVEGS